MREDALIKSERPPAHAIQPEVRSAGIPIQ
jgi:hypothetical protein